MKNTVLFNLKSGLGFALVALLSFGAVFSISAEDEESAEVAEEIVVTGSRIKRATNVSSPTPMVTLGEDQIENTGSVNVYDILNELPQAGEGISRGNTNFTVGSSGVQTVNLRGLGSGRTLTLVNGRRWVGGTPGTGVVDLNSIPTDLIERLEVITGGASSVYGSDAVAGVVNIILKDDFEGMSLEVMEGGYDAGDGDTKLASLTFGAQFADGRGSSIFNIRTDEQGEVLARNRTPYTGRDLFYYGWYYGEAYGAPYDSFIADPGYSSYPPQGRFFVSGTNADGVGMKTFDCSQRDFDSVVKSSTVVGWDDAGGSDNCGFNRTYYRALEVPLDRYSVFNSTKYEFDNGNTMFSEFSFTSVDSQSTFEPVPFNSEDAFGGKGDKGYNIRNPYMPEAIRQAALAAQGVKDASGNYIVGTDATGVAIPGMYLNAAGNEIEVPFIRRLAEFGTRGSSNTRQTFRASIGFDGTLSNGMDWDAYYSYGFSDRMQYSGNYNAANMAYAVQAVAGPTGQPVCLDPVAQARNCVPINLFGIDAASDEAVSYVKAVTGRQSKNKQRVAAFNITGDFNLVGFDASFAAGVERREENSADIPDALQLAGLHGSNKVPMTIGDYSVNGYYAELLVPLVQGLPFMQEITFETAYRVDHYSSAGTVDATKVGISWVINDDIRFRSVVSESVRAPSIDDLFSGQAQTYTAISDPCTGVGGPNEANMDATVVANCLSDPRIAATAASGSFDVDQGKIIPGFRYSQPQTQTISGFQGGNINLGEESADTTTVGFVWTPSYVEGLALTLDFYEIEIENVISQVSASRLINECYSATNYPVSQCNAHERFDTGHLRYWYSYGINQSAYKTAGYDVAAGYTFESLGPVPGELDIRAIWTRRDEHTYQTTDTSTPVDYVGEVGLNEDIARLNFTYTTDDWLVSLQTNYYGSASDDITQAPGSYHLQEVDSMTYLDLQVRYDLTDNVDVYFGIDNLSNKQPPYCPTCNNEPVPGAHYTAESYARVWDSKYHYIGFRWNM
jgi:outer membrane receptor protein involved in Fe transport|tara:strand:+ start:83 stop:3130 length:3048 start_codon:yes stop_codon:yes gene_type:complete